MASNSIKKLLASTNVTYIQNCQRASYKVFSIKYPNNRFQPGLNLGATTYLLSNNCNSLHRASFCTSNSPSGPSFLEAKEEKEFIHECEKTLDEQTREDTRFMGWNALHWAAFRGINEVVSELIKGRKIVSETDIQKVFLPDLVGVSPLHLAVERDHAEVVETLLMNGCDPNVRDNKPNFRLTPLHLAIRRKNPNINIINTLVKYGANVNQEAMDKSTPLFKACSLGRNDIVSLLVKNGANINIQNNPHTSGWGAYRVIAPLHSAVSGGFLEVVTTLLENGADVNYNLMDDVGETPLHVAAAMGRKEITEVLLKRGAKVNGLDCFDATPLDYSESVEVTELLKSHGGVKGKGKRL